jgi:septation ring formation regulator EzrA
MSDNLTENLNDSQDTKIDRLIIAVQSIDSRLASLETKVDQRLHDTQPIWEAVQAQLSEIRDTLERHGQILQQHTEILQQHGERLQRLEEDVAGLRGEVASLRADTEKGFRTIDRRMERQIGEFERLHAYQRDLEDRVDRIEKLQNP